MDISTTNLEVSHAKSVVANLKSVEGLPFSELLPKEMMDKNMEGIEYRERVFTPDVTLWAFLSQVLNDDASQQAAVVRVITFFLSKGQQPPSVNTSAYSQARTRLSEAMISNLAREIAADTEMKVPADWLWRGRKIKIMDGLTDSMPDTLENQEIYPQPDTQKPGVGFPIARMVAIIDYTTGVVLDLAMGPYSGKETGEHGLLRQLMHIFKPGDIALADCYYASFFVIAKLILSGVECIFPIHHARDYDFRRGEKIGEKDHIVQWKKPVKPEWMSEEEYDTFPNEIKVREVAIKDNRKGFRTKTRVLVTTFLEPKVVEKSDLEMLYDYRWFVEICFKSIKETMHMDILRGKTPEMISKEIWAHILAYNLIRRVMVQAAISYNKKPRYLSFKLAMQTINSFRQAGIFNEKNVVAYQALLRAVAYKTIGNRPGRSEPRKVKRRPKPFPRLQKARQLYKRAA